MENRPNTIQHAMKYGLYIGALFGLEAFFGASKSNFITFMQYFVQALVVIQSYRYALHYRDTELNGKITVWQSFTYTLNLFFFASLVGALIEIIYYKYINPTYLVETFETLKPTLNTLLSQTPNYSEEMLSSLFTAEQLAMYSIVGRCMVGMLLGLLYAPFLKRQTTKEE